MLQPNPAVRKNFLSILSFCVLLLSATLFCGCSAQKAVETAPIDPAIQADPAGQADPSMHVEEVSDPIEGFNRAMFWFNDKLYVVFLRPISKAYDAITPNFFQKGVRNFFSNLRYPIYLVSDLAQLKFDQAGDHTMRFLINTTAGIAGVMDVAKDYDYPEHLEDFGTALGYNGVEEGPYLVLPIFGPSNARDLVGRIVDTGLNPQTYLVYADVDNATAIALGLRGLEVVDDTNRASEAIDLAKKASVDYYLFVRSAYHQRRQNLIYDNKPPGAELEDEPSLDSDNGNQVPIIGQ
jgi:phospholipid-binding lipoprotein MlaA